MARLIGNKLPEDLYRRLSGVNLDEHAEKVIMISTVDAGGWPHPAMLSYLEVVAPDPRNIRLAPYAGSGSTANMRRNGKLTISIVDDRVVYYIKGTVREIKPRMNSAPHLAKLNLQVESVLADQANQELEAGAYVAGGVTYKNPQLEAEMKKARLVLKELLE